MKNPLRFFHFSRRPLPSENRLEELKATIRTATMLESWTDAESFNWLMREAQTLKDFYISKRDAAAADGVLQLTNTIQRAIDAKDTALAELEELRAEQRNPPESPTPADSDFPEDLPVKRPPQIT